MKFRSHFAKAFYGENMNILITGTTQGIGREIKNTLIRDNTENTVYTVNRRDTGKNNFLYDLSDLEQVSQLCKVISGCSIDILINNAGGSEPLQFEDLTADEITYRMNLNFVSPVLLMQAVLPHMQSNHFGRIINISSVTGKTPVPYLHIYGAAKAALDNVVKSTAMYYGDLGITINCICPGSVKTNTAEINRKKISVLHGMFEDEYQFEMQKKNGIGRMLDPKDVASVVRFLVSPGAGSINGQSINVCGTMEVH